MSRRIQKSCITIFDNSVADDVVEIHLLDNNSKLDSVSVPFLPGESQSLLNEFMQLLERNRLSSQDLIGVAVVQGAERFTVARLTPVIANALAWSMHIPILSFGELPDFDTLKEQLQSQQGQTSADVVQPRYAQEPSITI